MNLVQSQKSHIPDEEAFSDREEMKEVDSRIHVSLSNDTRIEGTIWRWLKDGAMADNYQQQQWSVSSL